MKKITLFFAALCCTVGLYAADCERSGQCGYDENNSIAWAYADGVLSFYGSGVMASYDAQNPAPWDCLKDEVTAVVFEHNVSFIAEYAFNGFTHLATVQLPTDSFVIGKYAFAGCTALEEVIIPAKVKYIRKNAFNGAGLQTVYLLGETPFEFLDYGGYDVPFNGCASLAKIYVPAGSLNAYQAYWSNTTYGNEAYAPLFAEGAPAQPAATTQFVAGDFTYTILDADTRTVSVKANSTEVHFPEKVAYLNYVYKVTALADNAFANNTSLTIYDIPVCITAIGANAFSGCTNLQRVSAMTETPATLGANAFSGLPAGFDIIVPENYEEAYKAAWSAYASHINVSHAPYAADVPIGDFTYYLRGDDELTAQITGINGAPTEITIPATVEYEGYTYTINGIEPKAFEDATSVEKLTLAIDLQQEDLNEGIGVSVGFSFDKATLDAMLLENSITQEQYDQLIESFYTTGQGTNVFDAANTTLKEVVIADGVTHIPAGFFGGMTGIERVVIPASVTSIDEDAFLNCTGIQSVTSYRTEPIDLAGTYRVFPRKNKVRLLYVSYAARSAYKDAKWDTYFYFDEQEAAAETDQVNVSSLESENTGDAAIQATLEAMQQAAQTAEADPSVNVVTTNLTIQRSLYKDGYLKTIC